MKAHLPSILVASALSLSAAEPPEPLLTLPVRVHLVQSATMPAMHTTLTAEDVKRILGKVNMVWRPAGIQFEAESVAVTNAMPLPEGRLFRSEPERVKAMIPEERTSSLAIDICYVKEVIPNGFYYGEPVVVKDTARLREVPRGIDEPLPRVTSHELGHALGLSHRQDTTNLMASGTTGFSLNDAEIVIARTKAQEWLAKFKAAANSQPSADAKAVPAQ